jgi:hypothetical protein
VIRDSSLGLVPETLEPIIDLQAAMWHGSSVGPALLELLRLRNARTVNCVFCKSVRYDIARGRLTEDKVRQIDDDSPLASLTKREKLASHCPCAIPRGAPPPHRPSRVRAPIHTARLRNTKHTLTSVPASARGQFMIPKGSLLSAVVNPS